MLSSIILSASQRHKFNFKNSLNLKYEFEIHFSVKENSLSAVCRRKMKPFPGNRQTALKINTSKTKVLCTHQLKVVLCAMSRPCLPSQPCQREQFSTKWQQCKPWQGMQSICNTPAHTAAEHRSDFMVRLYNSFVKPDILYGSEYRHPVKGKLL